MHARCAVYNELHWAGTALPADPAACSVAHGPTTPLAEEDRLAGTVPSYIGVGKETTFFAAPRP